MMKTAERKQIQEYASVHSLPYVALPVEQYAESVQILLPCARDRSEYEFSLVEFQRDGLLAAIRHAIGRARMVSVWASGPTTSKRQVRSLVESANRDRDALAMAEAFVSTMPPVIQSQGHDGVAVVIDKVKRVEAGVAAFLREVEANSDYTGGEHAESYARDVAALKLGIYPELPE